MTVTSESSTCCFFGHRKIVQSQAVRDYLYHKIEELICSKQVYIFLFGSKSAFNGLCYQVVTELQVAYPQIKRIYVRAEFPYIDADYQKFLLERYEDSYYPEEILNSGRAIYTERNVHMIDRSQYCITYYNAAYLPPLRQTSRHSVTKHQPKSGTHLAYDYAVKKHREIHNVYSEIFASQM